MVTIQSEVQVADLCGTLVKDDTTLGLLEWHFRRHNRMLPRILVQGVRSRKNPLRWAFAAAEWASGRHVAKRFLVWLLRGTPVAQLELSADEYAQWLLRERINPAVTTLLTSKRELIGGRCMQVIASASLQPIVAAISNELDMEYVASRLEEDRGRLTGRYAIDLSGRKEDALAIKFGKDVLTKLNLVVSDNYSDLSLMVRAHEAYAVVYSERQRRRWPSGRVHILDMRKGQ